MPATTTYGYLNPVSGDLAKGTNGWMASYNFNITRMDAHTHNGVDSAPLNIASLTSGTVIALAAGWGVNSGGSGLPSNGYVQTVTVPAIVGEINNYCIAFRINSAGTRQYQPVDLFYTRQSATTFNLYCSDQTLDILCVFR